MSDGDAFACGGQVVKNVTGYDLSRLLVGSRGSLALMTSLCLRTRPLVESHRLLLLAYRETRRARAAAELLFRRCDFPAGLLLLGPALGFTGLAGATHLALRLEGREEDVADQERHLLDLLSREALLPLETAREEGPEGPWCRAIRDFPCGVVQGDRAALRELRADLGRLMDLLPALGGRWALDLPGRRLRLEAEAGSDDEALGPGSLVLSRRCWVNCRGAESASEFEGLAGLPFLERVARAMDPEGRLAAGRWLFG